jgi:hypothetical protein
MDPKRAGHKILVIAAEPLLAALVGTVVEAARFTAAFPDLDERPERALERVKPVAAILLEASADRAGSDLFVARARKLGVRVLVFGPANLMRTQHEWTRQHGLPAFTLPDQLEDLTFVLKHLPLPTTRGAGRRKPKTQIERATDGSIVFDDASGVSWAAYDRRNTNVVDRRFVSEAGELRHCDVSSEEASSSTIDMLRDQLARASSG